MPQHHPDGDCNFYIEHLRDKYHDPGNEKLRKNQLINTVVWFREDEPHLSKICTWGEGENFKQKTGFKADKFIKSRIRKDIVKMPTDGLRGMWKITRVGTAGMFKLQPHTWNLYQNWLRKSSFRKL